MTHVESASDIVYLHNIEQWKRPPYNARLRTRESLNLESSWTLSSTPISTIQILWSLFATANMFKLRRLVYIHWLDGYGELEVFRLASSTLRASKSYIDQDYDNVYVKFIVGYNNRCRNLLARWDVGWDEWGSKQPRLNKQPDKLKHLGVA